MKKIFFILPVAVIIFAACQTTPKTIPVDTQAEKAAISALFDKFSTAFKGKDTFTLIASLTEDVLACGTDPAEFWDKKQISDGWTQAFADTSLKIDYSIDKREIRLSSDGNSALVIEQFVMKAISQKMPVRMINHVVKKGEAWMIDFISWNFIPRNEDIGKLNKALE